MAFERTGQSYLRSKDIAVGQAITAHVVGKHNGGKFPEIDNLVAVLKDDVTVGEKTYRAGQKVIINSAGNLKYFFKNKNELGCLYRITRMEDKVNPRKQVVTNFLVEVDREDKVEVMPDVEADPFSGDANEEHS